MAAKYDTAKFKGRSHDFITYWQNQVRLHASRVKQEERIHPAIKMTVLQNALSTVPVLDQVRGDLECD